MNDVKPLDEIDSYVLFSEHEDVFLFDKDLNKEVWRTSMYGNVTCGLLGLVNEWAAISGERLLIWVDNKFQEINDPEMIWIHDMRQISDDEIEILTDPWSDNSAVWKLNVRTFVKRKIKKFDKYRNSPYQEKIEW